MPSSLRILVADDNEKIRDGLCSALEVQPGWIVCGQAVDGTDAVRQAVRLKPDIVLVDVSMPGLNGFEAAECIHEQMPDAQILIVTEHDAKTLEHLPPQPGVRGYIVKSRLDSDLIPAVEAVGKRKSVPNSAVA
jgi:two-component system response regulator NreC